jgi:hypothetical protein
MFVVSEADAAAIRAIFHERGELSAVVELRRLFPWPGRAWTAGGGGDQPGVFGKFH